MPKANGSKLSAHPLSDLATDMKRNPWPYAIILYFVLFITAMTSWIVFAVRNNQELVRKDYYEQEIKYQGEIESVARGAASKVKVDYDPASQIVRIQGPAEVTTGTIQFYRPAHAKLDQRLPLTLVQGEQKLDVSQFEPGFWRVSLAWTMDGLEYRYGQSLVLSRPKTL